LLLHVVISTFHPTDIYKTCKGVP